jgi:hypothetical protein
MSVPYLISRLPGTWQFIVKYIIFYDYRSTSAMMMMIIIIMLKSLRVKTLKIFEGSRMSCACGMWLKLLKRRQHITFHIPRTFHRLKIFLSVSEEVTYRA